jgi:hypothetical protein
MGTVVAYIVNVVLLKTNLWDRNSDVCYNTFLSDRRGAQQYLKPQCKFMLTIITA